MKPGTPLKEYRRFCCGLSGDALNPPGTNSLHDFWDAPAEGTGVRTGRYAVLGKGLIVVISYNIIQVTYTIFSGGRGVLIISAPKPYSYL